MRLSKYPLRNDVQVSIIQAFEQILVQIKSEAAAFDFIKGLLTPAEQLMLAKRLAIILMLKEEYSYTEIMQILKVSQTTISLIKRMLENQTNTKLNLLIGHLIQQKETRIAFFNLLNSLSDSLLLPKGQNWRNWRKRQNQTIIEIKRNKNLPY